MSIKWICTKCGEKISDGIPENLKLQESESKPVPIDWQGICPLCEGKLKLINKK